MKLSLRSVTVAVVLGVGLPLLMTGCGSRLTPREMWDRLVAEKSVSTIATVEVSHVSGKGDYLTIGVPDSSGAETDYQIDSRGEVREYPDPLQGDEWHGRVSFSPSDVDFDALVARMPGKDTSFAGCDEERLVALSVLPTGRFASWTGCSSNRYNAGSLLVDGKPVNEKMDPRDPAQVAEAAESYNEIFGTGRIVQFDASVSTRYPVEVAAVPFVDDPDCLLRFTPSESKNLSPVALACRKPTDLDALIPFDLAKFSPSLVNDILDPLEPLGVDMSAIDYVGFTGSPNGNLKWDVSTLKVGDKAEHLDRMRGELSPIK